MRYFHGKSMVVKIVLMVSAVTWIAACRIELQHGLSERQANEILVVLKRNGISAEKTAQTGGEGDQWMVTVPEVDVERALGLLKDNGLPREDPPGFHELYGEAGLVPSNLEERARYAVALEGELAGTLETIDGILQARVHVVLPESGPASVPWSDPVEPGAAVLVKIHPEMPEAVSDDQIKELIAGSVPDLKPSRVRVIRTMARSAVNTALSPVSAKNTSSKVISTLKWLAVSATGICVLLAVLLIWMGFRFRRLRNELKSVATVAATVSAKEAVS